MTIVGFLEVLWECSWVLGCAGSVRLCRACWLHHPAKGALEGSCSHQGSTAQLGELGSSSWTVCSSRASWQELPVVVVTFWSVVAVSFLLCKRGKISIPLAHEKFPPFAGGVLTL